LRLSGYQSSLVEVELRVTKQVAAVCLSGSFLCAKKFKAEYPGGKSIARQSSLVRLVDIRIRNRLAAD